MEKPIIDYRELILEGIRENGGLEKDIEHLDPAWLKALGVRAANAGALLRKEFPSWVVEPICDIRLATERAGLNNRTFDKNLKLPFAQGAKRVYVAEFNIPLKPLEYLEKLAGHGLQPCIGGPSYLAGLMAQVPRKEMPPEIRNKWIVAAGPKNSIQVDFMGKISSKYFHTATAPNGYCDFAACHIPPYEVFPTHWETNWAFLAEKLN